MPLGSSAWLCSGTRNPAARCCAALAGRNQSWAASISAKVSLGWGFSQASGQRPRRALPLIRRSSKPLGDQSSPARKWVCAWANTMRKPARVKRDKGLSSPDTCGVIRPTGRPEAPWAGTAPASSTCTRKPRSAIALAALAPAKPLPKTKIVGVDCMWVGAGSWRGWSPSMMGGAEAWTGQAVSCVGRLGGRATFWRASAAVGPVWVGGWPQVWWGVLLHQASWAVLEPTHKLSCKPPLAKTKRCRPGSRPQQACAHSAAKGTNAGQSTANGAQSSALGGCSVCASRCKRWGAWGSFSHKAQVQSKASCQWSSGRPKVHWACPAQAGVSVSNRLLCRSFQAQSGHCAGRGLSGFMQSWRGGAAAQAVQVCSAIQGLGGT